MKECFKCNLVKPLAEFYKHKQIADGHLNKCKECTKKDVHLHREDNLERVRAYDRNRPNKAERSRKQGEYHKFGKGLEVKKISELNYRKSHPLRYKANNAVSNAVRDGRLFRPNFCSQCRCQCKPHGHHDDYTKPLSVRWLCVSCHSKFHVVMRDIYRNLKHTGLDNPFMD